MAPASDEQHHSIRDRLQRRLQMGLGLHLVAVALTLCLWSLFVRRGELREALRQELDARLATLDQRVTSGQQALDDLVAHQAAVWEEVRLYRIELRKDRADVLRYALFSVDAGVGGSPAPVTEGEIPISASAAIEIPGMAVDSSSTLLLQTSVEVRTNNKVREERGSRNRFHLRCRDAEGRERRAELTTNFFTLEQQLGGDGLLKGFASGHAFVSRGNARFALEIDAQALARNFYEGGICDLVIELGPGLVIGPRRRP